MSCTHEGPEVFDLSSPHLPGCYGEEGEGAEEGGGEGHRGHHGPVGPTHWLAHSVSLIAPATHTLSSCHGPHTCNYGGLVTQTTKLQSLLMAKFPVIIPFDTTHFEWLIRTQCLPVYFWNCFVFFFIHQTQMEKFWIGQKLVSCAATSTLVFFKRYKKHKKKHRVWETFMN